jgi:hypothetical protein
MKLQTLIKYADDHKVDMETSSHSGITVVTFKWFGLPMKAQASINIEGFYAFSLEGNPEDLLLL